jgi:hypothetical protein
MAKCKYRTLASKMKELLQGMDQFMEKTRQASQIVQFHFHERILLIGVPASSKSSFDEQVKAHEDFDKAYLLHEEINEAYEMSLDLLELTEIGRAWLAKQTLPHTLDRVYE